MSFQGDSIFWVEVDKIVPNPFQPRREFDEAKLQELSDSIRMYGILQPLTVTKKEIHREDGAFYSEYELIAGERRLRASKLAGLSQVPVIIRAGENTEQEKLELAIIENLQREDLNAVDRALAFRQLADVFELSHGQVAKKVGRSREYVSNTIRLLMLPEYMLASIKTGDITEGHARSLLMLKDRPEEQDVVYREILLKKLSVREVERIVRKIATDKVRKKNWLNTDPELIEIERQFTDTLGTRVQISKTDFGGKLTIDYFSDDDLKNLLAIITSQGRMSVALGEEDPSLDSVEIYHETTVTQLTNATPLESVSSFEPETVAQERPEMQSGGSTLEPEVRDHWFSSPVPEPSGVSESPQMHGASSDAPTFESRPSSPEIEDIPESDTIEAHTVPTAAPFTVPEPRIPTAEEGRAAVETKVEPPKEDPDKDLYSIRNFSL